jgi:hypothetical protein
MSAVEHSSVLAHGQAISRTRSPMTRTWCADVANNEPGVLFPVEQIAQLCRAGRPFSLRCRPSCRQAPDYARKAAELARQRLSESDRTVLPLRNALKTASFPPFPKPSLNGHPAEGLAAGRRRGSQR